MKTFSSLFIFCLFFINLSASPIKSEDFNRYFKLLPKPQKIEFPDGKPVSANDLRFLFLTGLTKRPVLDQPLGNLPVAESPGKGVITLALSQKENLPSSKEGYILIVKDNQVTITSRGEAGLYYGCQTLLQLIEDSHDQLIDIPPCIITDYPGVPYRGIHLDIRFHLNPEIYYYQLIDRLAKIKINAIIVEFEDKLRYNKAPVVGAANAISIDEFAAISRYAHDRNIDISPLVQGLGHAGHILKHEQYKYLRDDPGSEWAFDALKPETYDLQFALYEDAMKATPYGKYLHVGGDEVYNLGQSELAKKSGMKPVELQLYWLNKVSEFVKKQGRIPICWDDMFFNLSGLFGTMRNNAAGMSDEQIEKIWKENQHKMDNYVEKFPEECIYMRWTYWNTKVLGNLKAIDWLISQNLRVMGATAAQDMSPLLPRNNSIFKPIKDFCEIATEKKLDGILCTMWDDSAYSFETFWRGIFNFASMSWNYEDIKSDDFNAIFRHRFYAPELSDPSCEFQNMLELALWFWDGALINNSTYYKHLSKDDVYNPSGDRGDRRIYPEYIDLIELPDPDKPGEWSDRYKDKISLAGKEVSRYETIKNRIANASKLARRNHYSLALMNQINEFQIYSSNIILLLEKYDKSTSTAGRQSMKTEIQNYVSSFSKIRCTLENVISETRFLKDPDGYIRSKTADLANGGKDNDWMFVYETVMNEKVKNWLEHLL
ncbi:MAG: beta-N-acetylhexosaminidase [Bacteroidales bacterium]|nr:beta-N-acetylhexosaminidase [Bacteroidales bacterium]